ncbi:hypothetical protein [Kurthia sibirica]|nr:hypothetical protein [Kurthia sibirica]GEK35398.1 hypothetical protein KSI01_29310 [Kurthia sibirica]
MNVFYAMLLGGVSAIIIGFFLNDISIIFKILIGVIIGFLINLLKNTKAN